MIHCSRNTYILLLQVLNEGLLLEVECYQFFYFAKGSKFLFHHYHTDTSLEVVYLKTFA